MQARQENPRSAPGFASGGRLAVIGLLWGLSCISTSIVDRVTFARKDLPEFGATLTYPMGWTVRRGDFFHFSAESPGPELLEASFEYRGLEKIKKDAESRRLYAIGWYRAIELSYANWVYDSKDTDPEDPEATFRFEGSYTRDGILYRKRGILRFRGNRVHAMYYTSRDVDFPTVAPLFESMDAQHRYYDPEPAP
ncbi:MAG: hypothetical protein H7A21_18490 [Spirochaetales bacterium]|nr:hypothetical protein [Leptospiraceae bacterium]MCP5483431.1 hypothetical protein [Spirochaetales bacterium]MCP5486581.1 hypothetical protein [Spirochaetales bacterium]